MRKRKAEIRNGNWKLETGNQKAGKQNVSMWRIGVRARTMGSNTTGEADYFFSGLPGSFSARTTCQRCFSDCSPKMPT